MPGTEAQQRRKVHLDGVCGSLRKGLCLGGMGSVRALFPEKEPGPI